MKALSIATSFILSLQIPFVTALSSNTLDSSCAAPDNNNHAMRLRSIRTVLPRPPAHWVGDGFRVYPVFSHLAFTEDISPLLMFDYAAPKEFPPQPKGTPPLGVGQHPHRGFETVTLAFQGEVEHHDSTGQRGVIHQGDVQWMTAGRGILHQEYHSQDFTATGGTFEMCQLWVNLPQQYKMTQPGYQAIANAKIPVVSLVGGGSARIIAGELADTNGAAKTFSPVQMWDVDLPTLGSVVDLPFPPDHNCILFVRRGKVQVITKTTDDDDTSVDGETSQLLEPQELAVLRRDGGDTIRVRVAEKNSSLLVLGGEPLNEPIAAQGPFVMNTRSELRQAMMDYQMGKMGQ